MQDSEDRPQRHSALVARELARLDIDIAALSEVRFAEQGSLREDGAGWCRLHYQNCYCQKIAELASWSFRLRPQNS